MSVHQGKIAHEGRRLPFFSLTKPAMAALRREFVGAERKSGIAAYATIVERANDRGADSFEETRRALARDAGLHPSTLTDVADRLEAAGLLRIGRRRQGSANLPNRWTLTDPPVVVSDEDPSSPQTRRGPRLKRGGSSSQAEGSSSEVRKVVVSDEDPSSSQATPFKERSEEQEPAANAAAAGSPAATDRSSSDVQEPRREDPGLRYWDLAVEMLTAGEGVGFTEKEVEAQRPMILAELRRHAGKLADNWPWKRVTEQVIAGRADGSIIAKSPIGVLAFAVRQEIPTGAPPSAAAKAKAKASGTVRDGLTIPAATDEAEIAWRQLLEGLRETTEWPELELRLDQVLALVLPLTLADGVLRITGTQYAMHLLERDAIPVLDSYARQCLNGRVVLVPRDEAAVIA